MTKNDNLPPINSENEVKIVTNFLKTTFKNAGKTQAVIAVSGGIDSATSLMLTAKALNPNNIHTLHLPSKTTTPIHTEHAKQVLDLANIPQENRQIIPISAIIQKSWRIIKRNSQQIPLTEKSDKDRKRKNQQIAQLNRIRLGNLAARSRMMVIYDQAKKLDALVIGTENKSEHLLGYYTRFGDEASDIEPIRHLYKTQVIQLAKSLKIPPEIIAKPPTAGLWSNQTDAAELGFTYEQADPILYLHFEKKMSSANISEFLRANTQKNKIEAGQLVNNILGQVKSSSFKHIVPYSIK